MHERERERKRKEEKEKEKEKMILRWLGETTQPGGEPIVSP